MAVVCNSVLYKQRGPAKQIARPDRCTGTPRNVRLIYPRALCKSEIERANDKAPIKHRIIKKASLAGPPAAIRDSLTQSDRGPNS